MSTDKYTCDFCNEQVEYNCKLQLERHLRHCTKRKQHFFTNAFSLETAIIM